MSAVQDRVSAALERGIDARREELVDLARRLVRERSVLGAEEGAQGIVAERLSALGEVERVQPDARDAGEDPRGGYPALAYEGRTCAAVRVPGSGGGRSLHLSGHVDVVPVECEESWRHEPWGGELAEGRLWGRGAGDMKGGLAAYLIAAEVVLESIELAGDLVLSSVIEEECGGNGMRAVLAAGFDAEATLIGEPTGLRLHHAGVGVIWARLTAQGDAVHAQHAAGGRSAIEALLPAIEALRRLEAKLNEEAAPSIFTETHGHPYNLTLGAIEGGVWPSSTPQQARLWVRVGFGPELEPAAAQDLVLRTVTEAAPDLAVEFEGFRAHAYVHDLDSPLARLLARCHAQLHRESPGTKVSLGTTDARFVPPDACLCYGPVAGNVHGADEWVDVESLRDTALAVAMTVAAWSGAPVDGSEIARV